MLNPRVAAFVELFRGARRGHKVTKRHVVTRLGRGSWAYDAREY